MRSFWVVVERAHHRKTATNKAPLLWWQTHFISYKCFQLKWFPVFLVIYNLLLQSCRIKIYFFFFQLVMNIMKQWDKAGVWQLNWDSEVKVNFKPQRFSQKPHNYWEPSTQRLWVKYCNTGLFEGEMMVSMGWWDVTDVRFHEKVVSTAPTPTSKSNLECSRLKYDVSPSADFQLLM